MLAGNRSRRTTIRLITFVITLTIIISAILVTESILDERNPPAIPFHNTLYPYVVFRPPSNTEWQSDEPSPSSRTGEIAIEYSNKDGLRVESSDYQLTPEKPKGQFRIVVIGGSTVRIGTRFDVTLPGALKRILNRRFPQSDIEVINAGITSAISRQELIYLITTLVDYEPDMLIVYDGINDSGQMLYYERRPDFPYNFSVMERAWAQYATAKTESVWQHIVSRSAILSNFLGKTGTQGDLLNPVSAKVLINDKALRTSYAKAHIDNWEKIRRVCAAYGIQPYFVLQPTSLYGLFPEGKKQRTLPTPVYDNLHANYLVYEEFRKTAAEFSKRYPDTGTLDLSSMLPTDAFYDGAHIYDDVNDIVAARLAGLIESQITEQLRNKYKQRSERH